MNGTVLVVNAGSSSIKATVYDGDVVSAETQLNSEQPDTLVANLLDWISETTAQKQISAIGHRIVHGGSRFSEATLVDDAMRTELQSLTALDPDHLPTALRIIDLLREHFPDTPHIACFDTAFFHDLPRIAQIIPLPRKYESIGLRKYGFHGLSYQSILETLARDHSVAVESSRIVCAHLGSGVSVAAIANGAPIDTTMTMTPSSGLPMSSRSGSLDPGIITYLHEKENMTIAEFNEMTTKSSGLLGISETSADMYALLQQESNDVRSKEAIDVFCYEVKKSIGAMASALGGIDVLVFAGGMGENAPLIRQRICQGLEHIGVALDDEPNQTNHGKISIADGKTMVYVVHTDEARVIAGQVNELIQ